MMKERKTMKKIKLSCILLIGMVAICLLAHDKALAKKAEKKRWTVTNNASDGKVLFLRIYRKESPGRDGSKKWKYKLEPGKTVTFSGHGVGSSDPYMLVSYWNSKTKPEPRGKVDIKWSQFVFTGRRGAYKYSVQKTPSAPKPNNKPVELFTPKVRGIRLTITNFSSKADEEKVRRAFWIAMDRWHKPAVRKLAAKNAWRHREFIEDKNGKRTKVWEVKLDKPSETYDVATFGLSKYWGMDPKKMNANVTITGEDLGEWAGRAKIGIVNKTNHNYQIRLHKGLVSKRTEEQMAGTIFHEMLHNVGFSHNQGHDYKTDYKGYLIEEWGLSIATDGKTGFGLVEDPYKEWKK